MLHPFPPVLRSLFVLGASSALVSVSIAQTGVPSEPFSLVGDVYVTDSTTDLIFRLADLNLDGDANDLGEVTVFYDDTIGAVAFGNNSNITFGPSGILFVVDSAEDRIFRLVDLDGNGDANGPLEATVFFDGDPQVNGSAIDMASPAGLSVGGNHVVWVADSNTGTAGLDGILRLNDLNFDGDANDVGEAIRIYTTPTGISLGDSIPSDVVVGADGKLYYVESSLTGAYAKGIYSLDDIDGNDVIDPLTEVTAFFIPTPGVLPEFLFTLSQDGAGYFYISDTGNDVVWRVRDENGDGVITNATEASAYMTVPFASQIWEVNAALDGTLICAEDQNPDRVLLVKDTNGDGVIDLLTEVEEFYSQLLSSVSIQSPRGLTWERKPTLAIPPTGGLGTTQTGKVTATESDFAYVYFSTGLSAPIPLPPFGFLELGVTFPDLFGLFTSNTVPAYVPLPFPISIPSNPGLVGLQVFFQALVGKVDRFQLSNVQDLTIF
jgi:hypothetical protein